MFGASGIQTFAQVDFESVEKSRHGEVGSHVEKRLFTLERRIEDAAVFVKSSVGICAKNDSDLGSEQVAYRRRAMRAETEKRLRDGLVG